MLKGMLEKFGISTSKKITKNSSTKNDLNINFQKPGDYGDFELAPMSHIFTDYCKTTPSEDIKKTLEQITEPNERQEFIKNLEVEYEAIIEHYELNPQE